MHLYEELKDVVPVGSKVFEPGASWGKMLVPWKVLHNCEVSGVEPKKQAVITAKERLGIDLIQGFANDPRVPENTYDLVFNTRTINHMMDPLGDLRAAWRCLKPGGILFVDIADANREARYEGFERNVVEIDHCYMFTMNTLRAMVQKAGFTVIKTDMQDLQQVRDWDNRPPQVKQIRITARKSVEPVSIDWPDPLAELAALLQAQLEFDRDQLSAVDRVKERYSELRSKYDVLRSNSEVPGRRRKNREANAEQRSDKRSRKRDRETKKRRGGFRLGRLLSPLLNGSAKSDKPPPAQK
jgi:SAM-dependent methyltransferase